MKIVTTALLVCLPAVAAAEIHRHGGSAEALPHDKYVRVVSEADSPVQPTYVKAKDGLYVAAAIRKPKGDASFPAIVFFHGAPGGRGMEQLLGWSRGATADRSGSASSRRASSSRWPTTAAATGARRTCPPPAQTPRPSTTASP